MTKKHPHSRGDGGPGESPTERLLREALTARADQVSVHGLRPAEPPSRRVRRLRPVYIAAVPLFGLAAALAFGLLGFRGDSLAGHDEAPPAAIVTSGPSPTPVVSDGPTAVPSPTAAVESTPAGSAIASPQAPPTGEVSPVTTGAISAPQVPYNFRGVKFKLPAGWTVVPPDPAATTLCILATGAPKDAGAGGCVPYGVILAAYNTPDEARGATWPTTADLASDWGWSHQPYCPVWGNPHEITTPDSYKAVGVPVRTRDIVASRAVYKTQWQVACNATESFTSQMWGLRTDQVFLVANGLKPDYQADLVSILDTLDLSGRQAPLLEPHQNDVDIAVDGLGVGQQVSNDGTAVSFSVTYRNTGQTAYPAVRAVLFADGYAGAPGAPPITQGTLERKDGTAWTPLAVGVGAAPLPGTDLVFRLAPGQSRTVEYRMKLTAQDGAGVLPVTARAQLPSDGTSDQTLGEKSIPVRVVVAK